MKAYEKIGWLDHVQDIETGEVIQEGTPVSQVNMNHMDEGIFANREAVILHEAQIADAQKEIKVLKDATLNNMVNNVFLIKLTDYGFEYYGDRAELARVREKRCVYHGRAVSPTKEN